MSEYAGIDDPGGSEGDSRVFSDPLSGNHTSSSVAKIARDKQSGRTKSNQLVTRRATFAQNDGSAARHDDGRGAKSHREKEMAASAAASKKTVPPSSQKVGSTTGTDSPPIWKDEDPTQWRLYARGEAKAQITALLDGGGRAWLPLEAHPLGYAQMLVDRRHFATEGAFEQVRTLATLMDDDATHNKAGAGGRALLVPKKTRGEDGKYTLDATFQGHWQKNMLKKARAAFPQLTWGLALSEFKVPGLNVGLDALDFFKLKPWALRHGLQFTALQSPRVTVLWLEITGSAEDMPYVYEKEREAVEQKFKDCHFLWGDPDPSFIGHRCSLAIEGDVAVADFEKKRPSTFFKDYFVALLPSKPKLDKEQQEGIERQIDRATSSYRHAIERQSEEKRKRKMEQREARNAARVDASMSATGTAAGGDLEGAQSDGGSTSASDADALEAQATLFAGATQNVVKLLADARADLEAKTSAVADICAVIDALDPDERPAMLSALATAEDLKEVERLWDSTVPFRRQDQGSGARTWREVASGTHVPQPTWLNPRPFRKSNNKKSAAPAAASSSQPPATRRYSPK